MKLEQQVVSLELAKQLKELGVKQDSLWKWRLAGNLGWQVERHMSPVTVEKKQYSAFTVAELGELLPQYIGKGNDHGHLHISLGTREVGKWTVGYANYEKSCSDILDEKNEANARAKMLIYLLENGLHKN